MKRGHEGARERRSIDVGRAGGWRPDLGTATPTPDQVCNAVLDLLGDTEVRADADRLAAGYARDDPITTTEHLLTDQGS